MWQAFVASWLIVMTGGQLELNAPQNARKDPTPTEQPVWKPADEPADRPTTEKGSSAANAQPNLKDYQAAIKNLRPIGNESSRLLQPSSPAPLPMTEKGDSPSIFNSKPTGNDGAKPPPSTPSPLTSLLRSMPRESGSYQEVKNSQPIIKDPPPRMIHDAPAPPKNEPPAIRNFEAARALPAAPYNAMTAESTITPDLPKPYVTRQTYFSLPARNGPATQNMSEIVEVQMFVSQDRGGKWNFYNRVSPSQERIPFRAMGDGEYWFATRTLDRAGKFQPTTFSTPSVIVEIDSKPPTVTLSASASADGQVTTRWEISDPHLKADTLTVQYRASNNSPWQPVAVNERDSTSTETTLSGEASFWPMGGTKDLVVRAEVSDGAGNKGVAHAQVKLNSENSSPGSRNDLRSNASVNATPTGITTALLNNPYLAYLPPNEKPRMVNTRVFELDYDLQAVGPSGVSKVELFGTRDGGRTWKSYGVDNDNRSPMPVRIDEEGLYGFQIVVTSGAGLGDPPPKSGDKPAIWIGVDLTKPTAKITSAEFGGKEENKLIIAWEATDKMLAEKPITLSYSPQAAGPWTPFAANLENSGRYVWSFDSTVPPLVYIRLEVVDEAGNRAIHDLPQPIPLDRSRPSGRIRDVRPAGA